MRLTWHDCPVAGLELSEKWWNRDDEETPAEDNFAAVLREIELELDPSHDLAGRIVRVEARFRASDDVLVSLIDGTYALVHPTWLGHREVPPFPKSTLLGDAMTASKAIATWEHWR